MVKTVYKALPAASAASGLVTSGAGIFYGLTTTTTATGSVATYIAVFDASANSSGVYDYSAQSLATAASRLLWLQQIEAIGGTGNSRAVSPAAYSPPVGIHFYNGIVVGQCTVGGTASASTLGINIAVVYRNGLPSNSVNA